LQQEVDTAAQVEAEVHGQRVQRAQPTRRSCLQIQRDNILRIGRVAVERFLQQILHAQLRVGVFQAHANVGVQRRIVERHFIRRHLVGSQRVFDVGKRS
jgi:hypothetical protein